MVRHAEIVVMFVGPNYNGERDRKRIAKAIKEAQARRCPLVICGDSNGGKDLAAYAQECYALGIDVIPLGGGKSNTRLDARRAARLIATLRPEVNRVRLVTHVWHEPRSWIALQPRLFTLAPGVWVIPAPVWADLLDGLRRLPGEIRGCLDYLLRRPQRTYGKPIGKPDEERAQKEKPPPRRRRLFRLIFPRLARD
jgi:hypothetical protein